MGLFNIPISSSLRIAPIVTKAAYGLTVIICAKLTVRDIPLSIQFPSQDFIAMPVATLALFSPNALLQDAGIHGKRRKTV